MFKFDPLEQKHDKIIEQKIRFEMELEQLKEEEEIEQMKDKIESLVIQWEQLEAQLDSLYI